MVGWYHQLKGHEFQQTMGDSEGPASLTCYNLLGCKELDITQRLNYNKVPFFFFHFHNSMCWINAIALNLQIASSSITILTILVLPIQEHGIFTICFCHPHFLSSVSYCFWSTCLLSICLLSHFSSVQFLAILWTLAHQIPQSLGFSVKNTRVRCHALHRVSSRPGFEPESPALQAGSLLLSHQESSLFP